MLGYSSRITYSISFLPQPGSSTNNILVTKHATKTLRRARSSIISRDVTGTGLGLFIPKLLVLDMGEEIALGKSALGKGSTF